MPQQQKLHRLITRAFSYAMRAGHRWLGLRTLHTGQPAATATGVMFHPPVINPCIRAPASFIDPEKAPSSSSLCRELLRGYKPDIRKNDIGREGKATFIFEPRQRICYYPGKVHGGYQAFLMDQLFADCCQPEPAVTAEFTMNFRRPIQPDSQLVLSAWPVKVEGRKISMEGSIKISDQCSGQMLLAARATALFILPRPNKVEKDEAEEVDLHPAA